MMEQENEPCKKCGSIGKISFLEIAEKRVFYCSNCWILSKELSDEDLLNIKKIFRNSIYGTFGGKKA